MIKELKQEDDWKPWFAWKEVIVNHEGKIYKVKWEKLERAFVVPDGFCGFMGSYEYRFPNNKFPASEQNVKTFTGDSKMNQEKFTFKKILKYCFYTNFIVLK